MHGTPTFKTEALRIFSNAQQEKLLKTADKMLPKPSSAAIQLVSSL